MDFLSQASARPLSGRLRVPGDKSISHRALMLAAIAEGSTHISQLLHSEDTRATLKALRRMGVAIEQAGDHASDHETIVHGVGLHGLQAPEQAAEQPSEHDSGQALDLGNSGTSVRLLAGLLAGQTFDSTLCGDASLMQRPMRRITAPLQQMQADIACSAAGTLPIVIRGGRSLRGITYQMPIASAQLKSALLLAGLYASGQTCVREPAPSRDHTERMLQAFGCALARRDGYICLASQPLKGRQFRVPGDISAAAFFMVAASIVPGSDVILEHVGLNPTRAAVLDILRLMGAAISIDRRRSDELEPQADIRIRASQLRGITIPRALVPIAIDEFPALMVAAAYADGETLLEGAAELRVKESDRIKAMTAGLRALGIAATEYEDGMRVSGGRPAGGEVHSHGDHRIAMAFAIAALGAAEPVRIRDCVNVNTSFPGFVEAANHLGADLRQEIAA